MSDERACQQFTANLLIDGHNRYEICTRLGIEYSVSEMQFDCRDDAEDWIDRNQAGKRNLSPASFRIVSGRIYNRRKKAAHDGGKGKKRSGDQIDPHLTENTAAEVASELGVGEATIKRNGQRATLHDEMLDIGDEEAAEAVKTLPQADVSRLVELALVALTRTIPIAGMPPRGSDRTLIHWAGAIFSL